MLLEPALNAVGCPRVDTVVSMSCLKDIVIPIVALPLVLHLQTNLGVDAVLRKLHLGPILN